MNDRRDQSGLLGLIPPQVRFLLVVFFLGAVPLSGCGGTMESGSHTQTTDEERALIQSRREMYKNRKKTSPAPSAAKSSSPKR